MSFLGPEGVQARMAQIQARLDSLSPRLPFPANPAFAQNFDAAMNNVPGGNDAPLDPTMMGMSPVTGTIGGKCGASELQSMADAAAARNGVDPALFRALGQQESGWDPQATSPVGAQGLTQLMPKTAAGLGVQNPYDPAENLEGGARYLKQMLVQNHGDTAMALASYNAGYGRVNGRPMSEWPHETQQYVTRIMGRVRGGQV